MTYQMLLVNSTGHGASHCTPSICLGCDLHVVRQVQTIPSLAHLLGVSQLAGGGGGGGGGKRTGALSTSRQQGAGVDFQNAPIMQSSNSD